jgi:hydrogenase/urease accessory protein HupE
MHSFTGRIRSALTPTLALCLLLGATQAQAHFQNFLARIVHIEAHMGGTLIHARLPLAAVLLPRDWNPDAPLRGVPYVASNSAEDSPDALLLDTSALQAAPQQLETALAQALQLVRLTEQNANSTSIETAPAISAIRIQPVTERSPFTHLPQIRAALNLALDTSQAPREMADALVDFRAFYPDTPLDELIEIHSSPDEWPDIAARSINIITLYSSNTQGPERTRFTSSGVLAQRLGSDSQPEWRLRDSLGSGFKHVLIGLDHVLFMLILILAARHWRGFLRNSLAFTLGHSITLAMGAAGLLGSAPWFIPLIETAIALSILYSGACLLLGLEQRLLAGRLFFIGLLHGLGFAFMLQQASGQAPGDLLLLWFGFNAGIELAQLSIYALALPLLWLLGRYWPLPKLSFRTLLATPCLLAALFWSGQRSLDLMDALGWSLA